MDQAVKNIFESFPDKARNVLLVIRANILELAGDVDIDQITETLKWGEPSYLSKNGSTVRIGWSPKFPAYVSVYFNCNTILIETFKEIYAGRFNFVGNREIRLLLTEPIPFPQLMSCISMSLRYHKIKHLPLLGA